MVTKKPAKTKRRKTAARKPISRKSAKPAKKTVVKRKAAVRRAAGKKKLRPRSAMIPKARPARAPGQQPKSTAPAVPAPMAGEQRGGTVTHYYGHLSVAAVRMESGNLRVGDMIHVVGHTSDFRQPVESLQIEHEAVSEVHAGQEIGLRVTEHAREHDVVYKVATAQM